MSEVLQRTLRAALGSWGFEGAGSGPGWGAPTASAPHSLPASLAAALRVLTQCARSEEAELCSKQIEFCLSQLNRPGLSPALAAEAIVRGMFVHLMGHNTAPLHIHAVKLAQSPALLHRKLGYLACSIFLPTNSEFRILLTNSILRELESKQVPNIITGLIAACNILTEPSLLSLLQTRLVRLTSHENHIVRKKALVVLDRFCQIAPHIWSEIGPVVLAKLSDEDPGVVAQAVQLLALRLPQEVSADKSSLGQSALQPLLHIQDQIRDKKLPKDFLYGGQLAPWLRIDILRVLRRFNTSLTEASPQLPRVRLLIEECLDETEEMLRTTVGQALLFEAVLTLTHLASLHQDLLPSALQYISKLLQHKQNHVKYAGLCLLEQVFIRSPPQLTTAQETCLKMCLEHSDPAIQRKSLSLLTLLASKSNVRTVVDTVLNYLRRTDKKDPAIVEKVYGLIERLSEDLDWKASCLLRLIQNSSGKTRWRMVENLKLLLAPHNSILTDDEVEDPATELELNRVRSRTSKLLNNLAAKGVKHPAILSLLVWCEAEFTTDSETSTEKILAVGESSKAEIEVVVAAVYALEALALRLGQLPDAGNHFLAKCSRSDNMDIRDAAEQVISLMKTCDKILPLKYPQQMDFTLSFLDGFVYADLVKGGQPYVPRSMRSASASADSTLTQEKPWLLAPYHRLQQPATTTRFTSRTASSSLSSSTSSDRPTESVRQVWTLEGRKEGLDEKEEFVPVTDSVSQSEVQLEPSLEDVLSEGW